MGSSGTGLLLALLHHCCSSTTQPTCSLGRRLVCRLGGVVEPVEVSQGICQGPGCCLHPFNTLGPHRKRQFYLQRIDLPALAVLPHRVTTCVIAQPSGARLCLRRKANTIGNNWTLGKRLRKATAETVLTNNSLADRLLARAKLSAQQVAEGELMSSGGGDNAAPGALLHLHGGLHFD